jgi:hypothetical protein
MLSPKNKRNFLRLGIASLALWGCCTFGLVIYNHFISFSLPIETKPTVSLRLYQAVAGLCDCLIYEIIPTISAGYLLIGLLIFLYVQKSGKKDDDAA